MNLPRDREHDLERLLGEEGGEFGALYRRLSQVDPPRRLNRAVLGEAARAVHGRVPRRQRWVVGFGSAAGLVLAAGIAWQIGHEALREPSTFPTQESAPMVVPVAPITERRTHQSLPPPEAEEAIAPVASKPTAPSPPPSAATATKRRAATRPAAPTAARSMPPEPRPVPAPDPAPPDAFPAQADSLREEQRETAVAAPAANAVGAAKADAAGARQKEPAARTRRSAPPALSSSIELRRDMLLSPAAWIAHVRDLLELGRRQQAIESLQLFRRTHPDLTVPDDLQSLLD
jgi:hypothetical protein